MASICWGSRRATLGEGVIARRFFRVIFHGAISITVTVRASPPAGVNEVGARIGAARGNPRPPGTRGRRACRPLRVWRGPATSDTATRGALAGYGGGRAGICAGNSLRGRACRSSLVTPRFLATIARISAATSQVKGPRRLNASGSSGGAAAGPSQVVFSAAAWSGAGAAAASGQGALTPVGLAPGGPLGGKAASSEET